VGFRVDNVVDIDVDLRYEHHDPSQ
jgi:hypothetical protein